MTDPGGILNMRPAFWTEKVCRVELRVMAERRNNELDRCWQNDVVTNDAEVDRAWQNDVTMNNTDLDKAGRMR